MAPDKEQASLDTPTLDCGNNSCYFAPKKGGMRTNGGCRCFEAAGFGKGMHAAAREMLLEVLRLRKEAAQQCTLLTAMRQSCLAWFDNPNGPWGWECVACGAQFTKSAGPGQPPSETRAYAEIAHDAECAFHPTPRLPSSGDDDLP